MSVDTGNDAPNKLRQADFRQLVFASFLMPGEKLIEVCVTSAWKTALVLAIGVLFCGSTALWLYQHFLRFGSLELACGDEGRRCASMYLHSLWIVPTFTAIVALACYALLLIALGRRHVCALTSKRLLMATIGPQIGRVHRLDAYDLHGMQVKRGLFGCKIKSVSNHFPAVMREEFIRSLECQIRNQSE